MECLIGAGKKAVHLLAVGFAICAAPAGVVGAVAFTHIFAVPWWLSLPLFPLISAAITLLFCTVCFGLDRVSKAGSGER